METTTGALSPELVAKITKVMDSIGIHLQSNSANGITNYQELVNAFNNEKEKLRGADGKINWPVAELKAFLDQNKDKLGGAVSELKKMMGSN